VRLLADTHAALWLLGEDKRLSSRADELLTDATNEVLLSAAVVWEVAIKRSLGKLDAPDGFAKQLLDGGAVAIASLSGTYRLDEEIKAMLELNWLGR
jgi:PIN domain nuclease of toxin-antitoxin system